MRQEERWLLPDPGNKFVQIVRRWRSFSGLNLKLRGDIIEQAVLGIVNKFILLALFDFFDHQA